MSNGQGLELARMGRDKGLKAQQIQSSQKVLGRVFDAIRDDRPIIFGPMSTELQYPSFVRERLTPDLEVTKVTDPGEVDLWLDPRQGSKNKPTGHEVYEAHGDDRLKKALSLGHLKWFEENPDQIPAEWKGKALLVCGWASVGRDASGDCLVPYFHCFVDPPRIYWYNLDCLWLVDELSGLLAN